MYQKLRQLHAILQQKLCFKSLIMFYKFLNSIYLKANSIFKKSFVMGATAVNWTVMFQHAQTRRFSWVSTLETNGNTINKQRSSKINNVGKTQ